MHKPVRFGTDGIRGRVGVEITPVVAYAIGRAAAELIGDHRLVVAWDTRESSQELARAVTNGASAAGATVNHLGVVPTPVLAGVCIREGLPGCMITASHNLFHDNGLKLFDPAGLKLSAEIEQAVERRVNELLAGDEPQRALDAAETASAEATRPRAVTGPDSGRAAAAKAADTYDDGLVAPYVADVIELAEQADLRSLRVGFDFANGAGSYLGPTIFDRLDLAGVRYLGNHPDGRNINLGFGSTAPEAMMALVAEEGLDLAFAFDGDGDRVLAIDERGELVDGDVLIAILAIDMAEQGLLNERAIVVSNWSNLGLYQAMAKRNIDVVQSEVGDKYILELLNSRRLSLGGEQSGHIILRDRTTTGDGMLVAAEVLSIVGRSPVPLSRLAAEAMVRVPQVATAVQVKAAPKQVVAALEDVLAVEAAKLGDEGRAVLRPSGTEPVVRVMAEAPTVSEAEAVVDRLSAEVRALDEALSADPG